MLIKSIISLYFVVSLTVAAAIMAYKKGHDFFVIHRMTEVQTPLPVDLEEKYDLDEYLF